MGYLRGLLQLLIFLYAAGVCAGTTHMHQYSCSACFFIIKAESYLNLEKPTHTRASSTGVDGVKVSNLSSEICLHPCEDLFGLLTEIHGLRVVTNNLLEDLDRVVRCIKACTFIMVFVKIVFLIA